MKHAPVTVEIEWVKRMLAGVKARGEAWEEYLTDARIPLSFLMRPDARVTGDQYAALFRSLIEGRGDEGLGFLSRPMKYGSFALTAHCALGAPDLGHAIGRSGHALGLLVDDLTLESRCVGKHAGIGLRFVNASTARWPFLHEMMLRVYWQFFAWLVGGRLPALCVDFAYPRTAQPVRYDKVFPAPTRADCTQSAVWVNVEWLAAPVRRDEAALRAYLADAPANIILPRRFDDVISARVRDYLVHGRPPWSSLGCTANALHVSTATLQRRLAAENTSFQAVKSELRRDVAITRLGTSAVPVIELAQDLGFADTTAFQRAFKTWTGSAPGMYRRETSAMAGVPRPGH